MSSSNAEEVVRRWVEALVVGEGLCPFAATPMLEERVRFAMTSAGTEEQLLAALAEELEFLVGHAEVETTLLIHPEVLEGFLDYNQFLDLADGLLAELDLTGVIQIASFHPDYRFAGTEPDDPGNYTNRSPYPVLHLLREASLEDAIAAYPDVDGIPERNIARMEAMGAKRLAALLADCRTDN